MTFHLRREGFRINRERIRRLMQVMGLKVIYQASKNKPEAQGALPIYPYLLYEDLYPNPVDQRHQIKTLTDT